MKRMLKEIFMFLSAASMVIMVQVTSLLTIDLVNVWTTTIIGLICMCLMFSGIFIIKQETELFYEKMFNIGRLFAILALIPLIFMGVKNFSIVFITSELMLLLIYITLYIYNNFSMVSENNTKTLENS